MFYHESFQTVKGTIQWDHPMYKLYEKAKKQGKWNPADIDFSQDQEDFQRLSDGEKIASLPLVAGFSAGEEAVTLDILPMINAMARQGRLEDTMFLTTFLHDEAKHAEMFSRWQQAVGVGDMDLSVFHNDSYKRIFYEALPESMNRLNTDDSPEAVIRAATVYNMIVEGTLAESGYYAFRQIFKKAGLFPGILQGIDYLNMDEGRHIQFGIYTIQRLVAGNDVHYKVFIDYMDELWEHAFGYVEYLVSLGEQQKRMLASKRMLEVDYDMLKNYAVKQFHIRKKQIDRAKKYDSIDELEKALTEVES
ncbi:R2-like ligand-binding oxidase [Saccharococcus caldoxylosilyticus]|uniref:R2-like ligand binding oxidase n=1 Tax=Parageobacillus caldoxylosilyticus NBRC 107762 TaxID=1220594 RepID=A0A023DCG7_9BACL|nr:R2-like ligand-binding oxidase [Parageobacillus caldoxylosilyticus]MBB3851987.1 ribonucleoside-diphosphate reductase beta chain [Parageobacillus caldoxylosilyticus]QXJ39198.1 R2-like ligand binding oxidase [Parageobacillus caldoxylosilyticus]BDG37113.1 ribonucleotide-diphosphate reductase [Parageobacillus caldoxylosilyticus]BDG40904.1 ribonucleotide-diphosphate reductase [Parageobacillus caldoxylosilyticus]BDG44654.1 ribonucleotide-diphosphate reductase [Parageobacillus caldoxylosilyticus]